jgi:hypothetical protein
MNIDLFFTGKGEPGLICDRPFDDQVIAVFFDPDERHLSAEMDGHHSLLMNIPVQDELLESLRYCDTIGIGVVTGDVITQSLQVPLIAIEDDFMQSLALPKFRGSSVASLESFIRNCQTGQPVHRDDLGDETALDTIMKAGTMSSPQFSPQLAHQRRLEAAPRAPAPGNVPSFGPGGGGGAGGGGSPVYRKTPPAGGSCRGENN